MTQKADFRLGMFVPLSNGKSNEYIENRFEQKVITGVTFISIQREPLYG